MYNHRNLAISARISSIVADAASIRLIQEPVVSANRDEPNLGFATCSFEVTLGQLTIIVDLK